MKKTLKIIFAFTMLIVIGSCSTKKNSFVNRQYHGMSTKYNVLYNGKLALQDGLNALNANYNDNYWEILPVEPLKVDKLALPGMQADTDASPKEFEKAEEKAVKAIQKHSMLIGRKERNSQIDDAYLLLGKARYYSKRFVPAMEAFNYVIINYPNASLIDETRIWQAKTNLRLQNEDMAIESLKYLLKKESISKEVKEAAHTALAMAYTATDSIPQVIENLNAAVLTDYNKEQTARNLFILGQLYRQKSEIDSSNIAFQQVIDLKKAPYKYQIHAQIEQAKNVSTENHEETTAMVEELEKLIEDRYNRPYLDELYFRLGKITQETDEVKALIYYEKGILASNGNNNFQKELGYETIGNIYFDKAQFTVAGAYYDSVLQIAQNENTKRIRSLKRKRNSLEEVIQFENVAKVNDSILNIVAMNVDERTAFFNIHIEKLKAEEERKLAEQAIQNSGSDFFKSSNIGTSTNGKWYFYNNQTVGYGKQEFKQVWGNRPLEDNWRLSDKMRLNLTSKEIAQQDALKIDESKKFELSYYLDKVPTSQTAIDSLTIDRNDAYYNLGLIYQAQFKETNLAIYKLESLLTFNPAEELILPTKYQLYKMYTEIGSEKATTYKNDITTNYAESRYAKIILNPKDVLNEENQNAPEKVYAEVYHLYEDEKFDEVIETCSKSVNSFQGEAIVPKFELLKAYAIGKKDGLKAFNDALDFVATNYPNTEEGKKAMEVIEIVKTKI